MLTSVIILRLGKLTHTFLKFQRPSILIHVNAFLPLFSMTLFILFTFALQMLCPLLTLVLLLNSFDLHSNIPSKSITFSSYKVFQSNWGLVSLLSYIAARSFSPGVTCIKNAYISYHLPVGKLTHTFFNCLLASILIHVNAFLSLLSITLYTLFTFALQMLRPLQTLVLLLNSFNAEPLCTETPLFPVSPIFL